MNCTIQCTLVYSYISCTVGYAVCKLTNEIGNVTLHLATFGACSETVFYYILKMNDINFEQWFGLDKATETLRRQCFVNDFRHFQKKESQLKMNHEAEGSQLQELMKI